MKKFLKYFLIILAALILLPALLLVGLYATVDTKQPQMVIDTTVYRVVDRGSFTECQGAMLRKNDHGIYELYVHGSDIERGAQMGALTRDLMRYQEDVFVGQIRRIVPSDSYLRFLKFSLLIFNRKLADHITDEYRNEIYASSLFCTHQWDAIGSPYERQLNYHAAHDIGHTMQQYMLVGCSSLAVKGQASVDSSLIVGRNFDFFVGDDFARNKLVTFCSPDNGYNFASVGWAGMIGVLSGINDQGLTVTINAAKGALPVGTATPISILSREILQYASTIEQAYRIALSRKTFVSESIFVTSSADGRAAIIEKSPEKTALYDPQSDRVFCTNHFQSDEFAQDEYNIENIENSDSQYRYQRLEEMVTQSQSLDPASMAMLLRNQKGLADRDIGLCNEKSINQSIAHHSVIFRPKQLQMWVTSSHWLAGEYVCYDLSRIFEVPDFSHEIASHDNNIQADTAYITNHYPRIIKYRSMITQIKAAIDESSELNESVINEFKGVNANNYYTHKLLGDYYFARDQPLKAKECYFQSLRCEIPYKNDKEDIEKLLKKCDK